MAAKDSDNTLTIRGTPDDVELLLELVRYLDVKPRVVQVSARLIEIRLSEKGVPKESILQTPTIITRNDTPATCVTNFFDKSETKLGVTPHLNVDGSVSLTLSLSLRLFSGGAIATGEVKKITGLGKQGEWNPIQTISLSVDKEIQKTLRTSIDPPPAAAYPLYRLEVAVTEVSY
ncbi:MAG: hypothetical protein H8F28_14265 [Fibrella sp.]|nr:hypothetical protein [Armatimonadota bacterium]